MGIAELENRIAGYNARIAECYREISVLEEEIDQLTKLKTELDVCSDDFHNLQNIRGRNLDSSTEYIEEQNRFSKNIKKGLYDSITTILTGSDFARVKNLIVSTNYDILQNIQKRKRQIDELYEEIRSLNNQIDACNAEIASIRAREEEERRRREEDERRKLNELRFNNQ
jgi:prefoldin subunit 5